MSKQFRITVAIIVGLAFIALALLYWTTTADQLPNFVPGAEDGSMTIHHKHAIASFLLGVAGFVYAWFVSGKKN